jgi:hypothetical protein
VRTGLVLVDVLSFEVWFLDMMLRCQLSGFTVLDPLLIFQTDVVLYEEAKNALTRPSHEAQFFVASVINLLQPSVGACC